MTKSDSDEPVGRGLQLDYAYDENATIFFARGDIPDEEFSAALRREVDPDDRILTKPVQRGYMRYTPDPDHEHPVLLAFGVKQKRGAWRATWVSSDS